ncbi:MAG: HTH-type transcriptional activator Btr [Lentisphaerae bacterium ADurb.Bin242]|nr:MAG: HTH-type transcriptional activator Btr [Lentisphaerae bacterium ADurb.Bin242]
MRYTIKKSALVEVLGLLSDLLKIRITFFDVDDMESADEKSLPRSNFCMLHRNANAKFNRRCETCDKAHLDEAKQKQHAIIYRCHAGLLEGIVPLYNRYKHYLGSIVFGQLDDKKKTPGVKYGTEDEMIKIVHLLQIVSTCIIQQDIIQLLRPPWVTAVEQYIADNWNQKVRLKELSKAIGISYSQIAHCFSREFGMPLRPYLKKLRLERAKMLLENGSSIKECAYACGFYDEFHFSKAFKLEYGFSPVKAKPTHVK